MTTPGYLQSTRGKVNRYVYHRTDLAYTDPDKIQNAEITGLEGSNSLDGTSQATLDAYQTANFWTVVGKVLTYNPKTDQFGISIGERVL
jgi:hypothetical protein